MLNALALIVATIGAMVSFAAILAQFIGAGFDTLKLLSFVQLGFLVAATLLAGLVFTQFLKKRGRVKGLFKLLLWQMPGWLMFILLLLIVTALLGDLSVFLVRATGHQVTALFHLPSLCIVVYAFVYRLVHLNLTQPSVNRVIY